MKKLPKTGLDKEQFWADFDKLIHELTPENKSLLEKREEIQSQLDNWYKENKGSFDFDKYKAFLEEIGYLESVPEDFEVTTSNVDEAVTKQAGPQLVVPVNNARYAINAANARWGSLYDALYGTDAISEEGGAEKGPEYNPARGDKVIAYAKEFLDNTIPLQEGSHKDAEKYEINDNTLSVTLSGGNKTGLKDAGNY